MKKKFAIILSGCGVYDGTEIYEAVLTVLALERNGVDYHFFAPKHDQLHVVSHLTGEILPEQRNILMESARIARGKIEALDKFDVKNFDGIIFPGGYGVAKNLTSFAFDSFRCFFHPHVGKVIKDTHQARKPIGALCIAPAMITAILGNVTVTLGNDASWEQKMSPLGAVHKQTCAGEFVVDYENKIVSSPCYMVETSVLIIEQEIDKVVKQLLELV